MIKPSVRRSCAAAALALSLTAVPSGAAVGPACSKDHTPLRIWMGESLSQTFTPTAQTIAAFEVKLFFRRAFAGTIAARLQVNLPVEAATSELAPRGMTVATASAAISGTMNSSAWVRFQLLEPLATPPGQGPLLEIEMRPGGPNPAWAWIQCASSYRDGRAYGRAPVSAEGATVPNEAIKFPLTATTDLQFRIRSS